MKCLWMSRPGAWRLCSTRAQFKKLETLKKSFTSTVNRVSGGEACGALRNAVRAPYPSLPLCDPMVGLFVGSRG